MRFGAVFPTLSQPDPPPQPQPYFCALDQDGVREREMVFDGGCLARTRFGVVWARLRFGGKTGGLALFLKSGDEFQGHFSSGM